MPFARLLDYCIPVGGLAGVAGELTLKSCRVYPWAKDSTLDAHDSMGQRVVRVVWVGIGMNVLSAKGDRHVGFRNTCPLIPLKTTKDRWGRQRYRNKVAPRLWQACRLADAGAGARGKPICLLQRFAPANCPRKVSMR